MNILIIHSQLPGQFIHLIRYFSSLSQFQLYGICEQSNAKCIEPAWFEELYTYKEKQVSSTQVHYDVTNFQRAVFRGQSITHILEKCKTQGLSFDIALCHTGWGEALYLKTIYPDLPLIGYVEFFFNIKNCDVDFDPASPLTQEQKIQIKNLNAQLLLGMNECDALVSPTYWQQSLFPDIWKPNINVIHEGVDTELCCPDANVSIRLPNGLELSKKNKVVTYCARNLEPYRGFPVFMKAIDQLLKKGLDCHVLIVGGDDVSYSPRLPGESYRTYCIRQGDFPEDKVHFLGEVDYEDYLKVLQISSVHIYLTYPFVLSWSLVEAMATGCAIIASDTGPLQEIIQPENNGLMVEFFDYEALSKKISELLHNPEKSRQLGVAARKTVIQHYRYQYAIQQYLKLIHTLTQSVHA